jgi:hypothetical protein
VPKVNGVGMEYLTPGKTWANFNEVEMEIKGEGRKKFNGKSTILCFLTNYILENLAHSYC